MARTLETVQKWLTRICGHEGGFTDHPKDDGNWTGGKQGVGILKGTKWGISAATYPNLDIKSLTMQDACKLYEKDFIAPLKMDGLGDGISFQLLDFAINSGQSAAVKGLQRALKATPDGVIGPATAEAAKKMKEHDLILLLLAERLEFMAKSPRWVVFGAGWANRIAANLRFSSEDV